MRRSELVLSVFMGFLVLGITTSSFAFADIESGHAPTEHYNNFGVESYGLDLIEPQPIGVTFFGNGAYSADGTGGDSGSFGDTNGPVQAEVPAGSTVEQAYLYLASYQNCLQNQQTAKIDGKSVTLERISFNNSFGCAYRADVTSEASGKIANGGGITQFNLDWSSASIGVNGMGLVVIYSNPSLPEVSIAIMDGGQDIAGDTFLLGLAQPLTKGADFSAIMSLGIGHGYQGNHFSDICGTGGQASTVDINGQRLASCAGGADDGRNLLTIGGVGDDTNNPADPFQTPGDNNQPRVTDDELYDISSFLNNGDTQIKIDTVNPSSDDLIFLAVIQLTARASVGEICGDEIDNDEDGSIDEGCEVEGQFCKEYDFNSMYQMEPTSEVEAFTFGGFAGAEDWSGAGNIESVQGYTEDGFDGTFLRNTAGGNPAAKTTLTLTDLPEHTSIDLEFLLAIIDSWDGSPPGGCCNPDILNVFVDGIEVFSESFGGNSATYDLPPIGDRNHKGFNSNYKDVGYNMTNDSRFQNIPHSGQNLTIDFFASGAGWQAGNDESWALENFKVGLDDGCAIPEPAPEKKSSGGDNQWDTRPTFGVSHETRQGLVVENGFSFNGDYFTVTDNHHTDFAQQSVEIGAMNSFSATVYADKKLKVQEFLFGIPTVGESHLAELGIEVWYDRDGNIDDVKVIQDTAVIDESTISVSSEKTKCLSTDPEPLCVTTNVAMTFLEPLMDDVMAIKAIDWANRDQRTYLNDGFDISGDSLNPMINKMIPSNMKNQGLIQVTQLAKYSPYWQSDDGRMFEMNSFGSFKEINQSFERFADTGDARTRMHSGFGGILDYEQNRATQVFDSTKLISELPDSFGHHFEMTERLNDQLLNSMIEQQEIAKEVLKEMDKQNRHY